MILAHCAKRGIRFRDTPPRSAHRYPMLLSREQTPHVVAGADVVVVHLSGGTLFAREPKVVGRQDTKPRAVAVVDEVMPAIVPDALVPVPITCVAAAYGEIGCGSERLGLHPVVLVSVADRGVGRKSIVQSTVDAVPGDVHSTIEQLARARHVPRPR